MDSVQFPITSGELGEKPGAAEARVHPTACVHPGAKLGEGTTIGAYSIIDDGVVLGDGCKISDHVIIRKHSVLGNEVDVHPFVCLGGAPQHVRYKGEPTTLEIGDRVIIRENVTIHRGTAFDKGTTTIGDDVMLLANSHVAHDCVIGKQALISQAVQLAGHVELGESAIIGGFGAAAPFCRIGDHCFIGGGSVIRKDIPPYLLGKGADFRIQGINSVGLTRRGFSKESIRRLKKLFKIYHISNLTMSEAIERIVVDLGKTGEVEQFLKFVESSKVGVMR